MFILPNSHKFPQLFSTSAWFPRCNCIKPCIPWPQHCHQWCWYMPSYSTLLGWCSTLHIRVNLSLQDHACGEPLPWILMMATNEPSWLHIGSDWRLDSVQERLFVFLIYMCEALCLLRGPLLTENPCLDFTYRALTYRQPLPWLVGLFWYAGKLGFLLMSSWFCLYLLSSGRLLDLGKVGLELWSYIH